jgi:hypothetical protein
MRAFISTVVGLFVASIVGELVGASLFTAFRRLYRPPHGRATLGATWLFAIAGFIGAATHRTSPSLLQLSFLVGIPGLAFIAVLVTRDEYREARGQAPINHHAPGSVSGFTRAALLVLGGVGLLTTLGLACAGVARAAEILPAAMSALFLYVGIRKRVTPAAGIAIGDPPDSSTLD